MSVDETLMCSFQILKPAEKKPKFGFGSTTTAKPGTPASKAKVVFLLTLHFAMVYQFLSEIFHFELCSACENFRHRYLGR